MGQNKQGRDCENAKIDEKSDDLGSGNLSLSRYCSSCSSWVSLPSLHPPTVVVVVVVVEVVVVISQSLCLLSLPLSLYSGLRHREYPSFLCPSLMAGTLSYSPPLPSPLPPSLPIQSRLLARFSCRQSSLFGIATLVLFPSDLDVIPLLDVMSSSSLQ